MHGLAPFGVTVAPILAYGADFHAHEKLGVRIWLGYGANWRQIVLAVPERIFEAPRRNALLQIFPATTPDDTASPIVVGLVPGLSARSSPPPFHHPVM